MKRLLNCLILLMFSTGVLAAVDIEGFCQSNVAANTQRAQWGLSLRQEMEQNCAGQNLRICSHPYRDAIIRQEQADEAALQRTYKNQRLSPTTSFLLGTAARQKTTAAYMALRGVDATAEQIAAQIYQECVNQLGMDLSAAVSGTSYAPSIAPVCSNYAGSDDQYRQRCCTPDCYCDVYCQ